ncbi:MAG TPA: GntR family transcriptional regulator [Candidatus Methylacidiphilales bacterium]
MNIKREIPNVTFETQAVELFHKLEFEILSGQFEPGARLVRRELTKRFGVSQATVSEALWRLESEGLAESAPMYGTRVTRVTPERVADETLLREALECQVARRLAENFPKARLAETEGLADRVDAAMAHGAAYTRESMEIHAEFHIALARLTGSALLTREVERIWRRHFMFFNAVSAQVLPVPDHWHRELLARIAAGYPDDAERAMRHHVLYGSAYQLQVLGKVEADKSGKSKA